MNISSTQNNLSSKTKPSITGLVLTYNGERLLEHCLKSLQFCNHILVVDSWSSDKTFEISSSYNVQFVQHNWSGPVEQFNYAFSLIKTEWIITLDQDEICSTKLQHAIITALCNVHQDTCGFYVPRRSWYYDRFLKYSGWYPDYLLRVFRKDGIYFSQQGVHEKIHPHTYTQTLIGDILHYPYKNFYQHLEKINSYAQHGTEDLAKQNKPNGVCIGIFHGLGRFIRIYILKRGFLDGKAGLINAIHGAFYAFLKYIRINEGNWGAPYNHQ